MAMGKTISINLDFNANTSKAKAQMRDLQKSLDLAISASGSTPLGITPQLEQARRSAMDLKIALNNATNVDTGKLNLNKFQAQLAASGRSVQQIAADMRALGPEGVKAFNAVATAVSQADTKLFSLQGGMKKLMGTFMNTVRWQIAASAIQGVTSSIQETIQFAADLDKSLTNIQIVTNKSAAEMARFGKQANIAAKELSTATTKYTDASLIYYQQGLSDSAVKQRTDTTVKLAAVAGKTASEVSEWMTAIWNNFDDGSQSLESYADKLTALGAATASSADEIAGGLEKFAAVAETVGLSYDYAAAALATITAQTRQSEDVVGTSLKTIFARMENLKLGEVLDDGTTLGQYAAQMEKVGVSIKDTSGNLKDMDIILDELGARWETLARDEQVALAQGVAGIRQYNQFISLMDNWDIMQENVKIAEQANGILAQQFSIYEDSAEAHKERMQASAESLKALLLGGEDLKGYYSFMADFLEIITDVLESVGGLPTILYAVAAALMKIYQPQVATFLSGLPMAFKQVGSSALRTISFGRYKDNPAQDFKQDFVAEASKLVGDEDAAGGTPQSAFNRQNLSLQTSFLENETKMNEATRQRYLWEIDILKIKQQQVIENEKLANSALTRQNENIDALDESVSASAVSSYTTKRTGMGRAQAAYSMTSSALNAVKENKLSTKGKVDVTKIASRGLQGMQTAAQELGIQDKIVGPLAEAQEAIDNFSTNGSMKVENLIIVFERLQKAIEQAGQAEINQAEEQIYIEIDEKAQAIGNQLGTSGTGQMSNAINLSARLESVDSSSLGKTDKKQLEEYQKQARALAEERKGLEEKIKTEKKAGKSTAELTKRLELNKTKTKELSREVEVFGKKLKKNSKVTEETRDAVREAGAAAEDFGKSNEVVVETQDEVIKNGERLQENMEKNSIATQHWSQNLANLGSGIATSLMSMSMLRGAFESLSSAIASGDADLGDWLSSLGSIAMSIMMAIPGITQMSEGIAGLVMNIQKKTSATEASTAAQGAETAMQTADMAVDAADNAMEDKEQKENLETAGTNVAKGLSGAAAQAGKGPAGIAAAIASIAMITAIAGMIGMAVSGISSGKKQAAEEKQAKQDEQTLSTYEASKEETNKHGELIKDYRDLLNTYKETGDGKDSLVEKAKELAKAYDIEDLAVYQLTEDYNGLLKKIEEVRKQELQKSAGDAKAAQGVLRQNFEDSMRSGIGYKADNGGYGLSLGMGTSITDEQQMFGLFQKYGEKYANEGFRIGTFASNKWEDGTQANADWSYMGVLSDVNIEDPKEFLRSYDILKELFNEATAAGVDTTSEMYKELQEWLAKAQEDANALRENIETYESFNAQRLVADKNISQITNISDYLTATDSLLTEKVRNSAYQSAAMTQALGDAVADPLFELVRQTYESQLKQIVEAGVANPEGFQEKLRNQYVNASEAMVRAMSMVEITEGMTWEEFQQEAEDKLIEGAKAAKISTASQYKVTEDQANAYTKVLKKVRTDIAKNVKEEKEQAYAYELISEKAIELKGELEDLTKVWEDNSDALIQGDQNTLDYAYALADTATALENFFGTDVDLTTFVENNTAAIEAFLKGEEGYYEAIAMGVAKQVAAAKGNLEQFNFVFTQLQDNPIDLGEIVDDTSFYNQLNELLAASDYTATEIKAILTAAGYTIDEVNGEFSNLRKIADNALYESYLSKTLEDQRKKREENLDSINDELSRYHEIERVQSTISRTMDKIGKIKDRAYGKDKIAAINAEAKAYELSAKAQGQLAKEAEKYLKSDRTDLENFAKQNDLKLEFDSSGGISNYTQIERQLAQELANITDINGEKYEEAEKRLQDFKDLTSKYEESQDKLEDAKEQEKDDMLSALDAKMEAIEYTVEINLEINDRQLEYLQRKLSILQEDEDDYYSVEGQKTAAENRRTQLGNYQREIETNEDGIKKILELAADEKDIAGAEKEKLISDYMKGDADAAAKLGLTAQQMEDIKTYTQNISDANDGIRELVASTKEDVMATHEYYREILDAETERLDHLAEITENYKNIAELTGEDNEEFIRNLEAAQMSASERKLQAAKTQLDNTQHNLNVARENLAKATDEETKAFWEQTVSSLNDQLLDDQATFTASWSESLQTAADIFDAQMERSFDKLDEQLAGSFGSLEKLAEAYDQQQEIADRYLDNSEKLYELSKLNRKIQKDIDNSTNVKGQRELLELQEMINAYEQDGVDMSKADLEALQKRYDLKLAEIALEEAQNAKSQVRLTRNAQGGMSYVYTANQENMANAQQKYEDELEANRKLAEQQSTDLTSQIISNRQALVEALRSIRREDYEDTAAYEEALAKTQEYYSGLEAYLIDEKNKVIARSQITYADDYLAYNNWSNQTIDISSLVKEELAQDYNGMGQNSHGWVTTFGNHTEEMIGNYESMAASAEELRIALGSSNEDGTEGSGIYYQMVLGAAGWVSGLGHAQSTAAAQYDLLNQHAVSANDNLGDGSASKGTYGQLLINAGVFSNNLGLKMGEAGQTANYLLSGKDGKGGFSPMSTTLGGYDQKGTILGGIYDNVKVWETNVDGVLDQVGKDVNDLKTAINTAMFGSGTGTATNPTGGIAKTINDTGETITTLGAKADDGFEAAADGATRNLPTLDGAVQDSEKKVDNLNESLDTLDEKNVTAEASVEVGDDTELETLVKNLQNLTTELGKLTSKTFDIKVHIQNDTNVDDNSVSKKYKYTHYDAKTRQYTESATTYNTRAEAEAAAKKDFIEKIQNVGAGSREAESAYENYLKAPGATASDFGLATFGSWGVTLEDETYTNARKSATEKTTKPTSWRQQLNFGGYGYGITLNTYDRNGKYPNTVTVFSGDWVTLDKISSRTYDTKKNGTTYLFKLTHKKASNGEEKIYFIPTASANHLINTGDAKYYMQGQVYNNTTGIGAYFDFPKGTSFDTGGYTGEWGPDGRIAMLHQKEIVLNAHDTENLLQTVDIVRQMAAKLDLKAMSMAYELNNLASLRLLNENRQAIDQNVTITAEFPNVTNKEEIESAFENMVNLAAQYAYSKEYLTSM